MDGHAENKDEYWYQSSLCQKRGRSNPMCFVGKYEGSIIDLGRRKWRRRQKMMVAGEMSFQSIRSLIVAISICSRYATSAGLLIKHHLTSQQATSPP
jgi:hypothetical protein